MSRANQFNVLGYRGRGSFSTVWDVSLNQQQFAMKYISIGTNKQALEYARQEVGRVTNAKHDNVLRYYLSLAEEIPQERVRTNDQLINTIHRLENQSDRDLGHRSYSEDQLDINASRSYCYFEMQPSTKSLENWINNQHFPRPLPIMKQWVKQLINIAQYLENTNFFGHFPNLNGNEFFRTCDIFVVVEDNQPVLKIGTRQLVNIIEQGEPYPESRTFSLSSTIAELLIQFENETEKSNVLKELKTGGINVGNNYDENTIDFLKCCFESQTIETILAHDFLTDNHEIEPEAFENFIDACDLRENFADHPDVESMKRNTRFIDQSLSEEADRMMQSYDSCFNNYTVETKLGNEKDDLFFVKNNADKPLIVRRVILSTARRHIETANRYATLDHPGLLVKKIWVEHPPKGYKVLQDMINLRKMKTHAIVKRFSQNVLMDNKNVRAPIDQNDIRSNLDVFIIMQICDENLSQWLNRNRNEESHDLEDMKSWIKQLANALAGIHDSGFVHRNVKSDNILLLQPVNSENQHPPLIIGNFEENADSLLEQTGDIFDLGLVSTELIIPFQTDDEKSRVFEELKTGKVPEIFEKLEDETKEFLCWLTAAYPENRPTVQQVLAHPFLA